MTPRADGQEGASACTRCQVPVSQMSCWRMGRTAHPYALLMPNRNDRIANDRRARRDARESELLESLWEAPADNECDKDESIYDLPLRGHRLVVVLVSQHGRLVRFFIAWEAWSESNGRWEERYSICTRHGYVHEHLTGHRQPNDRRNIAPITAQVDVQESHDNAYEMVHNRYIEATGGGIQ